MLQSNGTHVLADGQVWAGVGVNAIDEYKCGVCRGGNKLSQAETLRRLAVATDCLGATWVRYNVMDGVAPPADPYGINLLKESHALIDNPTRLATLDAAVALAAQKGIYFEIALWLSYTLTNPSNPPSLAGAPYSWPSAATVDWWRFVAARYKSQPHVFFGLLNEPQYNSNGAWDAQYTASVQPVVDAIRSTGATNLIAVGASRMWARFAEGFLTHPIVDTNWAAAVHFYLTPAETVAAYDKYCKTHACIVEEFGPAMEYTLAGSQQQVSLFLQWRLPFAGWIADEDCEPPMLVTTNAGISSCANGRPLRTNAWGDVTRNATGWNKTCTLLV